MKKFIKLLLANTARVFSHLSSYFESTQDKVVRSWFNFNGDVMFKTTFHLTKTSIVFDVGGYKGQWTSDIFSKYLSNIYIFEPVKSFYDLIVARFNQNSKIKCFNFGLSNNNRELNIFINKDGSSYFRKSSTMLRTKLVDIAQFIKENKIDSIDLMSVNIEGGEYDLLDRLILTGLVKKIKNIQVQFHDIKPNSRKKMLKIQSRLKKTHKLTYQFVFVWENWRLKNAY